MGLADVKEGIVKQMDTIKEFLLDILHGYKYLLKALAFILFVAMLIWGIFSGLLTIAGKMNFNWWNVPCWFAVVSTTAGCFGQHYR